MISKMIVAFVLLVLSSGPIGAEPLTTLAFGAGFAASVGGQLVSLAIGLGVSYVARRFLSQGSSAKTEVDPNQVAYGERVPRQGVIGRVLLAGHRVHYNEFDNAKKAQIVQVLADGWCDDLEGIQINGRQYALSEVAGPHANNEAKRYQVVEFGALIDIRFHDGRPNQLADTEIVAQTPNWDSSKKYAGLCYVAITLTSDKEKFNGLPEFQFILRGLRLYDPRKDSSVGGVGAHRFDTPSTWEYSANPMVGANHFARGFMHNGKRVLGAGLGISDLDFDGIVTVMNVADEQVQRPDGSWRNRYEANLLWQDTQQHAQVIDQLIAAAGGQRAERQGKVTFFAGKAQANVLTITDADLVSGATVSYSPKRAGASSHNGIQGTYTHSTEFVAVPYKLYQPQAFVDADGRSTLRAVNFDQVQDAHQAYLLVKQALLSSRVEATAQITLDLKDLKLEVGDWFEWQSDDSMIGTKTWQVVKTEPALLQGQIRVSLDQVDIDAFADDASAADVAEPARPLPFSGYQQDVFGFDVQAIGLSGANGETLPALELSYNSITDPAVRGVKFEYRIVGDAKTFKAIDNSVGDGVFNVSDGVMPGQTYEARAILDSIPGRVVNWTNWQSIAVPTGPMAVAAIPGFNSVDWSHLAGDLSNTIGALNGTSAGSLQSALEYIIKEQDRFASEVTGETVHAHLQRQLLQVKVGNALSQILTESTLRASADTALADLLTIVSTEVDEATAAILLEQTARANADGALAVSLNETIAAMGDAYAQGLFKIDADVTGGGAEATMTLKVRAGTGDNFVDSGLMVIAKDDGTSQVVMVAEETVILDDQGALLALFGNDGMINSAFIPSLTVNELSALSADLGTITAGLIQSANGKMVIDLNNNKIVISD